MTLSDLLEYPQSRAQRLKQIAVLVFLAAIFSLPFIEKAYHIDDVHFLEAGRRLFDFKHFYTTPFYSFGERYESAINFSHPLVVPYIIHLVMRAIPTASEAVFHAVFLVFSLSAIVFTYLFCLRFSRQPFLITLCFLFSPAYFVLSHNIMSDIVLYSLIIGSIACFVQAVDCEHKGFLAGAIILFALALGTGFQSMVFYSAFFFYSYYREPRKLAYFWAMSISCLPFITLFGIQFIEVRHLPSPINFNLLDETGKTAKYLYFASHLSLAYLSPIILTLAVMGKKYVRTTCFAGLIASVFFFGIQGKVLRDYAPLQKWTLYAGLFITLLVFGIILRNFFCGIRNHVQNQQGKNDLRFLVFTTLTFFLICVVFTPFGANRYLIPIMAFVLVLIVRDAEIFRVQMALGALVVSIGISLSLAKSDYDLAGFYKRFATEAYQTIPPEKGWFMGEWGIRHYMTKTGYKYLSFDSRPAEHDMVVEPVTVARMGLSRFAPPLRLKKILRYQEQNTLKVLSFADHVGFWSQGWGLLPFWPSDKPLEEIRIYEAMPEVIPFNLLTTSDSFTLPADLRLETKVLRGQAREALLRDGKPGFAFSLHPHEAWQLQFGLGFTVPNGGSKEAQANFKIIAVSGEERKVLFDHIAHATEIDRAVWADSEIDLTPYKGRLVKLVFQISDVPPDAEAFWSSLNLVEVKDASFE